MAAKTPASGPLAPTSSRQGFVRNQTEGSGAVSNRAGWDNDGAGQLRGYSKIGWQVKKGGVRRGVQCTKQGKGKARQIKKGHVGWDWVGRQAIRGEGGEKSLSTNLLREREHWLILLAANG